jgi:3-oxoacyl-[acyl-carrier-protein] synthase II
MDGRVVITGIGLVTPVGLGTSATWAALLAGQSGVAPITHFDASRFRVRIAAEVKHWDPAPYAEPRKLRELDRFTQFALGAAHMAVADAGLTLTDEERESTGSIVGVGIGGVGTAEQMQSALVEKGTKRISPYAIPRMISNLAAGQISIAFGLYGPSYCTSSACSSGSHALGEATQWIRRGHAEVMLAGGAEAAITPMGIAGFEAMHALSRRNDAPVEASRPFDRLRDGFVCGEGAGILVLESLERALRRSARIYAEVVGYGTSSDAHHVTHPPPEGEGAQRSMRMALRDAHLAPDRVDYVNAHATSTPTGDVLESRAIARVFASHATDKRLWVSSTKSMTGHLLGAAGALESAVCALAIHDGRVPPTINQTDADPECTLDYVPGAARERDVRVALNNSFGYGGTNCSLLFARFER